MFFVTTAMHFVQANVAMYVFFQHDPYAFFATKCWKTMALLCLWLPNQSVRFDHFFYPLRAFLINDPKKLSFTRFSHNDKKYMGFWVSRRGNSKANPDFQVPSFSTEYLGCALSWNASSGLPEEHLLFEHLFHFHDVSMHLGSLNPLMRCHEQR